MKTFLLPLLLTGLLAASVLAHHGNAAFDVGKKLELKGTVTEWVWANPHCWLKFDVKDANGKVVNWVAETTNSADMTEKGWSKRTFKAGDQVTVTLEPVKSAQPVGRLQFVVLANGQTLGLNYVER